MSSTVGRSRGARVAVLALAALTSGGCAPFGNTAPLKPVHGLDFGPYTEPYTPPYSSKGPGNPAPDQHVTDLLQKLKGRTDWVKLQGSAGGLEHVPHIAHQM